jgi:hypothetical protein
MTDMRRRPTLFRAWPWFSLFLATLPSIWLFTAFPNDIDPEFPDVKRVTFSAYPPAAYRWAEAGDSTDHAAVYIASAAVILSVWGSLRSRDKRAWLAALAISVAAYWHAATPGPLLDGWHGMGWRAMFDSRAPLSLRISLATAASTLFAVVVSGLKGRSCRALWQSARASGTRGLLIVAALLVVARQSGWLDHEPAGYWPRWLYAWGLLAWAFALLKLAPKAWPGWSERLIVPAMVVVWLLLNFTGRGLFWYQRPLRRLREVVPGQLYISAMPSYWGLELAQKRHHFRTIVNLFPEYVDLTSPDLPDELRFAREHQIKVVGNFQNELTGEDYVARALAIAQDPESWPVLVHCHASMDRSPAWMGIYRFVVQGWPLADAIREVEHHRGDRPRASVTLLYNRVLPLLAPERYKNDPTAAILRECAAGTVDPVAQIAAREDHIDVGDAERRGLHSHAARGNE